jgi:predicted esterase YcpF (UPF0227 family)
MEKIIIYCHGYGSNANSSKLQQLKNAGFEAYCFNANINPIQALEDLTNEIDMILVENFNRNVELVFVGTSLGGWMASKLSEIYSAKSIIINPSINPKLSLLKYGVSSEICNLYNSMKFSKKAKYFFAENDEIIDNVETREKLINEEYDVTVVPNSDHRFDKNFNLIIECLDDEYK